MMGSKGDEDNRRIDLMVDGWLTNKTRFCISEDYETANRDECYWGLPSVTYDDPAFPALGYWRGFIWGPMAQLTHWSLDNWDRPNVKTARIALARQMKDLFVDQWIKHSHVCENYLPHKFGTEVDGKVWDDECTGTTFYHWGALSGLIHLDEMAKSPPSEE